MSQIGKNLLALGVVMLILLTAWAIETLHDSKPTLFGKRWLALIGASMVALLLLLTLHFAHARDLGQWGAADPTLKAWYESLMQPDVPTSSCCGEADAYWADEIHVRNGKTFAVITDDRPDEPRKRPHIDVGTEIEIPDYKLKWDKSNPTGHGVVFLSRSQYVFCFVQHGGV